MDKYSLLKGYNMKNGIYLFVVLFLGIMGYIIVNDLMTEQKVLLAGTIFLIFSVVITMLITHYKKHINQSPAQKVLNIVYVGLFALYGFIVGGTLMFSPDMGMSSLGYEGFIFVSASSALLYGIYKFVTTKLVIHQH